ncbi:erythromycin esterase family protein [Wenzhouxiangella sp. AB-CW3]|uniref:erythromycin esterase family protein n=1 Tax=Wenzhouxiangella sp. AB-CW3 TaxID=2771012 RepID=UPI00168AA15A|nr:erythromycin esterase family protein [Wenzhouxiangella sp. AB-CW3]QOC21941.1 erythromycin esterase family protein [Wenzhouxiangella sp. AB-CW3]
MSFSCNQSVIRRLVCLTALILLAASASAESEPDSAERYGELIAEHATKLENEDHLEPLIEAIGQRRFVLLGEASHGTREFYVWRDRITRRLVQEKGFDFIAVEGDWRAIGRLNEYVTLTRDHDDGAGGVMQELDRWPQWLWANNAFADFCEWLRDHNKSLDAEDRIGLYGLDLQNPEDSVDFVLAWFETHQPDDHDRVKSAYSHFLDLPDSFDGYPDHLVAGNERLSDQARLALEILDETSDETPKHWQARQNARAIAHFEQYIHGTVRRSSTDGWNRRVAHFHDTLEELTRHHGDQARGVLWAHNTHVGDARATPMHGQGQVSIGQLLRQDKGEDQVFTVGFSTHSGEVMAARTDGASQEVFELEEAQAGSVEALLEAHAPEQALVLFGSAFRQQDHAVALDHRAIGVVFDPAQPAAYVPTLLPWRYDALIFISRTSALNPLHP